MFYTTPQQDLIMKVLEQTGVLCSEHVLRLLRGSDPRAEPWQAEKQLRQLRYMGKLVFRDEKTISLPERATEDPAMLTAISVMLDISENAPISVSTKRMPYLLTFLASMGPKKDHLTGYGILPVPEGGEQQAVLMAQASDLPHIPVFLLTDEQQQKVISFPRRYYLALCWSGRLRYREGGGAG